MSELEIFFESAGLVVLVVTAGILYWYTRETVGLRRAAQEQNGLLAEQIREARKLRKMQDEKDLSLLDPIIVYRGGTSGGTQAEMHYENRGGAVKHVSVKPLSNFRVKISPPESIQRGERGTITVSKLSSPKERYRFQLTYENATGEVRHKIFQVSGSRFEEEREKPVPSDGVASGSAGSESTKNDDGNH